MYKWKREGKTEIEVARAGRTDRRAPVAEESRSGDRAVVDNPLIRFASVELTLAGCLV